jgi:dihydroxyacetone kinase
MQKILNDPLAFVDEMLEGIMLAHPDQLRLIGSEGRGVVRTAAPVAGKVGIATGGGSGHLPVFMGYVGEGLADGAAIGNVFASPSADQMLEVTRRTFVDVLNVATSDSLAEHRVEAVRAPQKIHHRFQPGKTEAAI